MPHSAGEDWIATHEALKCSRTWDNLAFDGIQGGGGTLLVEHRRCPDCGSTMSRAVDLARASDLISRLSAVLSVSLDAVATAARACAAAPSAVARSTRKRRIHSAQPDSAASTEPTAEPANSARSAA
jgi:hypothetical protein